jgi:hypothetical protein
LASFLRGRGERARILAPRWVRARVLSGAHHAFVPRATWAEDLSEPGFQDRAPCNFVVLSDDVVRERATIKSLVLRPGCKVFGLFQHIVPALLCHADGLAQPVPVQQPKRYAILCVPRSGSRFLAATLWKAGVGAPLEHLREPLATVITNGRFGFAAAIKALEKYGQANGIFGTKLVSTFLIDASGGSFQVLVKNVDWLAGRGYCLVHLERPLIESVVSSYIAVHLKKWHFFEPMDEADRQRLETLPFSENQIWGEYIRFRADKAIIGVLVKRLAIPTFQYTEVCEHVEEIVNSLCVRMGTDASKLKKASLVQTPVATRSQSWTYGAFSDRLNELLDRRKEELDAQVLKRIGERTGLQRSGAQKLLREYVETGPAAMEHAATGP